MNYVVGFCRVKGTNDIVLIKKLRPAWQNGELNGVGGKIKVDESPKAAMIRKFLEETGLGTSYQDWTHFIILHNKQHDIHYFFTSLLNAKHCKTMTDEEVVFIDKNNLDPLPLVPNLRWQIPLAFSSQCYNWISPMILETR